jgi:hypothetical protein
MLHADVFDEVGTEFMSCFFWFAVYVCYAGGLSMLNDLCVCLRVCESVAV